MEKAKRLFRSREDKVLGGVCGGMADYFKIDPVIVRILWIVAILLGGWVLLAYFGAWIIVPKESEVLAEKIVFDDVTENKE